MPFNLDSANTKGITCICHCIGVEMVCPLGRKLAKAILLLCTVDLTARVLVLNMKHLNGICGCSYCEDTGQTDSPLHRFWPFTGSMVLRTHHSVMDNAKKAHEDGTTVCRTVTIYIIALPIISDLSKHHIYPCVIV